MTESNGENEKLEPATPEMMQLLLKNMMAVWPELIKGAALDVGHDLTGGPDIIYQYTTISGLRGMVEKDELWTTPVGYLNDATEYRHGQQLFVEIIENQLARPEDGNWKVALTHLLPTIQDTDPNNIFVTCFASDGDQLSQWRGYASDGYGYAIGFDMSVSLEIEPSPMALQVIYEPSMQQKFANALLQQSMTTSAKGLNAVGIAPTPRAVAELLSFAIRIIIPAFKHPGFAEEREVRMFLDTHFDKDAKTKIVYHERKGILVPHIPLKWKDSKLPIKEIIVGPNLNFEQAKWSLQHFLGQNDYPDVEIKRSMIPYLT